MDKCKRCKKILLPEYRFCPRCGFSIYGETPEKNLEVKKEESGSVVRQNENVTEFFKMAQSLTTADNIDLLLQKIGSTIENLLNAERSSIMLLDETGKNLYFKTATGEDILKKLKIPVGEGIAGWIAQSQKPEIVNDPYSDERFSPETDKSTGFTTRSIVGAPMMIKDKLIGVAEVINKRTGGFKEEDMNTLEQYAQMAAATIENLQYQVEQKNLFSNMLDFLVISGDALSSPEKTSKGHPWEMAKLAPQLAKELGFSREKQQMLQNAAMIHDIGFIGLENTELIGINIDVHLDNESKYMLHPIIGAEMVKGIKKFKSLSKIIRNHHRYRNGEGFPENIPQGEITKESEIISVLEDYMINRDGINLDKFSPEIRAAFRKIML